MRKDIYLKGYINYEEKGYTFIYENKKLTLICTENNPTFFSEYKYVEEFKGLTLDGFDIAFNINNNIYFKNGSFVCSPRCILISQRKNYRLEELKFDSLRVSGGIVNRFYSNRKMIEFDPKEEKYFKFKKIEDTVSEEDVILNGENTKFELSIMNPGWKDDGIITFNNYDALLRVKYNESKNYKSIIKDLNCVDKFFKFCANRIDISFDKVFLEIKNKDKKYELAVEIIIPYMIDKENNKDMIDYNLLEGNLNNLYQLLDNSGYIFSIIPEDNNSYGSLSNKDYCAAFSCFESIFQYIYGKSEYDKISKEEQALDSVKKELLPFLEDIDNKYKGKDKIKRNFVKRFKNLILIANLKIEKCIISEFEKNDFVIESIYYKTKDNILANGINESIIKAVADRDDITHNHNLKLDNISIGIYEIVLKLNYIMILESVGISKEDLKDRINYPGLLKII